LISYVNHASTKILSFYTTHLDNVQPPADVLAKIANVFGVSIDYLVFGNTSEKAQQTLKDAELIKQFEKIDSLPEEEKETILKVISAFVRDFNAKQAYLF
jgi:transcriptional regulator with XRE-family HTH domain